MIIYMDYGKGHTTINDKIKSLSLILALLALWFFTHPYIGIYHDARLYAVQALSHLFPEAFKNDLFFIYGSQDSYTIFSFVYAYAIKQLDLNTAAIALQALGHILWLSAVYLLARSLLKGSPASWFFLVFVCVLSGQYGKYALSYGEPFLTPRIFSEALVLFSIVFLVGRKDVPAFLLLSMAFLFHPLMAAGGIIFSFIYKAYADKKWLLLPSVAALLAIFAASLQIQPFPGLFETMDKEWYEFNNKISSIAFIDTWESEHFNTVLFDASIIGSAFLVAAGDLRRFFFTSLLTGSVGIFLSSVGTYVFRNVFVIQVQPWRALWLMHLFAYLAGAFLIFEFWSRSRFSRLFLAAYLTAWFMAPLVPLSGILTVSIFLTHFLTRNKNENEVRVSRLVEKLLFWSPLASGAIWLIYGCLFAYIQFLKTPGGMPFPRFAQEILLDTKLFLIFGFLSIRSLIVKTGQRKALAAFLAVSLLLNMAAIWMWDHRSVQDKFIEGNGKIFENKIPAGSVICWPDYFLNESSIKKIWFMMGSSGYADPVQAAGIIFSREKAMKYFQRMKRLESLGFFDPRYHEVSESGSIPKPAFSGLVHVCRDPEVDYIVLNFKYPDGAVDSYYDEYSRKKYFLYDCTLIRNISDNADITKYNLNASATAGGSNID